MQLRRLELTLPALLSSCIVHYALPCQVINHKKVDALLMQWEAAIAERERAALKEARTRREPMHFSGKLGSLLNCCTACGCAGCPDATELCGSCCPQHVVPVIPEIEVGWIRRQPYVAVVSMFVAEHVLQLLGISVV